MADILCPICNRVNDSAAERCWYCQARLHRDQPVISSNDKDSEGEDSEQKEQDESQKAENHASKDESEIPDWLARIRQLEQEDRMRGEETPPFHENEAADEEIPEWLNNLRQNLDDSSGKGNSEDTESQPVPEPGKEEKPEYIEGERDPFEALLEELGIGNEKSKETPPDDFALDESKKGDQTADFFRNPPSEEKTEPEIPSEPEELKIDIDEFIRDRRTHKNQENPPAEDVLPVQSTSDSLEKESEVPEPEPGAIDRSQQEEEIPADLRETPEENEADEQGDLYSESYHLADADLPEWLSLEPSSTERKTEKPAEEPVRPSKPEEGKLERAQLPAWLHAIRPVEAMTPIEHAGPSEEEEKEEGLLAGIDGVLRSANISSQVVKPHVYTPGIQVSERQQQNAALFKKLLEGVAPESPLSVLQKPQSKLNLLLRVLVTVVLLAVVFFSLLSPAALGVKPTLFPSEVVSTFSEILNLPTDKPVLLAAHFESALAGEITWSSRAVINHLLSRNIPLALLSTNGIGYAVLEEEIQNAAVNQPGYGVESQLVNFGYLPGGTLGVLSLTRDLHQTLPFTTNLQPAWKNPVLQNINRLSDFGAVIIFTDNADIVRTWVEQAGTSGNAPNIIAVVSAQASPMIQPYYGSGQIKGFVSGLNGSLAYEQIMQRTYSVSTKFGSYQVALLVVVVIIFLGGAVTLVLPSGSGIKKERGK